MPATEPHQKPPKSHRMVYPWLSTSACAAFEAEAKLRHVHRDRLAAAVLEAVARDDLFVAVLER